MGTEPPSHSESDTLSSTMYAAFVCMLVWVSGKGVGVPPGGTGSRSGYI